MNKVNNVAQNGIKKKEDEDCGKKSGGWIEYEGRMGKRRGGREKKRRKGIEDGRIGNRKGED